MNYTEKYHLPQWVKEDRIMMDDFNRMCADIEAGLAAGDARNAALTQQIEAVKTTAETPAFAIGLIKFDESQVNTTIKELEFSPKFIVILVSGSFTISGIQRSTMWLRTVNAASNIFSRIFLDGNKLVLQDYKTGAPTSATYVAFR